MKISPSRLKRIIQEELFYREFRREGLELEKAELIKEQNASSIPHPIRSAIDGWAYRSEEELNGQLSQIDRRWNEDPEVIDAILEALDLMKANFVEWGKQ